MSVSRDSIVSQVRQLVEPLLEAMGFELVDTEYRSERGRWVLRIYADQQGGITLGDCAVLSRQIGDLLEAKNLIQHEYVLEVSSPGLDRPLIKEKDFIGAIGKKIKVKMSAPVDGRRNFIGQLESFQDGILYLRVSDKVVGLSRRAVEKANLVYEFTK